MIRINLLRSTGFSSAPSVMGMSSGTEMSGADQQKLAIGKLVVMLIFPLLLYGYEYSNLSGLKSQFDAADTEAKAVEAKKAAFGDAGPKVEKYTKQKKKIDAQMVVIRALTKSRLREVKALDAIQEITPPQIWYDSLTFDGGEVTAKGYAVSDADLQTLYSRLSTSPLFSNFTPGASGGPPDPTGKSSTKFECKFRIGRQDAS
jgi:Tfp pilus assembly protein PilN